MVESNPLVSVLMCSFNPNFEYLNESIRSVLDQSYKNIELIFVNDGSTIDGLSEFISSFSDNRIIYIDNKKNKGLTKCLNQGLHLCHGEFIARMDDDDVCVRSRIEAQVDKMLSNENINILGTDTEVFGGDNRISHYILSYTREQQQIDLFFGNVGLPHPTVMFRKKFLESYNISYNENYEKAQDYGLWVDCTQYDRLYCMDKVLLKYRCHPKQASTSGKGKQIVASNNIRINQLERLGIVADEKEKDIHLAFCNENLDFLIQDFKALGIWIRRLIHTNCQIKYFDVRLFNKSLVKRLLVCLKSYVQKQGVIKGIAWILCNPDLLFKYF